MRLGFLIVGCLSVGLGTIGIVLPLLPTTPFLLLAAFCFGKSSHHFHKWLHASAIYHYYVGDYFATKTIPRKRKYRIILNIYLLMAISIYLAPLRLIRCLLFCLTLGITYYLFKRIPDGEG